MLRPISRNYLIYLLSPVTRASVSFLVLVPVTTYYLEPEDFGIYAAIIAITNLVPALSMIGPSWVMFVHYFGSDTDRRSAMISTLALMTLGLSMFWTLIFFMGGHAVIGWVIGDPYEDLRSFYSVALFAAFLNFLWPVASNLLVLEKQAASHALAELGAFVTNVGGTIVALVLLKFGTLSLFIGPAAGAVTTFLISFWFLRHHLRPKSLSKWWIGEIVRRGGPALPTSLSETGYGSAERFFLSFWAGLHDLGIYAHSQSYRQVFSWGGKAFKSIFSPEVLLHFHEGRSGDDLEVIMRPWLGMLAIGMTFTALFGGEIIAFLTHDKFTQAAPFVFLWCILIGLQTYGLPYTQYLLLKRKTTFVSLSGISINLATILVAAILIYAFGIYGAAAAAFSGALGLQMLRRRFAIQLGCRPVAEKEFMVIIALSFMVFGTTLLLEPGILWKTAAFLGMAGIFAITLNVSDMFRRYRASLVA